MAVRLRRVKSGCELLSETNVYYELIPGLYHVPVVPWYPDTHDIGNNKNKKISGKTIGYINFGCYTYFIYYTKNNII